MDDNKITIATVRKPVKYFKWTFGGHVHKRKGSRNLTFKDLI